MFSLQRRKWISRRPVMESEVHSFFSSFTDICHHRCLSSFLGEQALKIERKKLPDAALSVLLSCVLFCFFKDDAFKSKIAMFNNSGANVAKEPPADPFQTEDPFKSFSGQMNFRIFSLCQHQGHHRAAQLIILILEWLVHTFILICSQDFICRKSSASIFSLTTSMWHPMWRSFATKSNPNLYLIPGFKLEPSKKYKGS